MNVAKNMEVIAVAAAIVLGAGCYAIARAFLAYGGQGRLPGHLAA